MQLDMAEPCSRKFEGWVTEWRELAYRHSSVVFELFFADLESRMLLSGDGKLECGIPLRGKFGEWNTVLGCS